MRQYGKKFIGKKIHSLVVLRYLGQRNYECLCECGNLKIFKSGQLIKNRTKSCGCAHLICRPNYDEDMKTKLLGNIINVNGCWEWQGAKHRQGYGHFPYKRKLHLAHRISWKLFKGEVPENMNVCHKCDNPVCVNPEHLFLGTQKENMKDMFSKNRKDHGQEKHPRVKLSKENVLEILELLKKGISQEVICNKFGITNGHVGSIKHRRTWKNL